MKIFHVTLCNESNNVNTNHLYGFEEDYCSFKLSVLFIVVALVKLEARGGKSDILKEFLKV